MDIDSAIRHLATNHPLTEQDALEALADLEIDPHTLEALGYLADHGLRGAAAASHLGALIEATGLSPIALAYHHAAAGTPTADMLGTYGLRAGTALAVLVDSLNARRTR